MRFSAAALLVAVLSMGAAAAAHAQAPIARSEFLAEPEDDPTELLVDFGFVETSGNNDVTTLTLREAYAYDPAGPWAFGQKASWLYGKQDGESNANTITFNLRADPFERGDESMLYDKWLADRGFVIVPAQAVVAQWLASFKEFPIRQKPASFNLDEVMQKMSPKN